MAERVGFEPTVGETPTSDFESDPFSRSGTSPQGRQRYPLRPPLTSFFKEECHPPYRRRSELLCSPYFPPPG